MLVFDDYPLDKFALGATIFNPIDLSRILVILKLDISALLGYTGAVFQNFFGTGFGMFFSLTSLILLCNRFFSSFPFKTNETNSSFVHTLSLPEIKKCWYRGKQDYFPN